jgi:hypothetical protein
MSSTGTVTITDDGRSGSAEYREDRGGLSFYWEFAGDDAVAVAQVSDLDSWRSPPSWLAARRTTVLRFVADELVRQKAPACRAEIDEATGSIVIRRGGAAGAGTDQRFGRRATPAPIASPNARFIEKYRSLRTKLALAVLALTAAAAGILWIKQNLLVIDPGKGSPVGSSARTDKHIATFIQHLEPYTPSLHRDHSQDRYRLSVFLVPLDGGEPKLVPFRGGLSGGSYSLARILGSDGRTLWFEAGETGGIDLQTFTLRSDAEVRAAGTLPQPKRYGASFDAPKPDYFLAAGAFVEGTQWLGVHSFGEFERDLGPRRSLRRVVPAVSSREMRRLYRAVATPDNINGNYLRIVSSAPVGKEEFFNAAFVRMDYESEPLRLDDPDGMLMLFSSDAGRNATIMIARVDVTGAIRWKADTQLDRFTLAQLLPGDGRLALVGARVPVPDKVSEPLLVLVDHATGALTFHSLWR